VPKILCASTPRDARCLFLTAATTRRDVSNLSRSKDHEAGRQRHGGAGDGCIERNRTDARRRSRARAPRRGRLKNAAQANALVSELACWPSRVIAIKRTLIADEMLIEECLDLGPHGVLTILRPARRYRAGQQKPHIGQSGIDVSA